MRLEKWCPTCSCSSVLLFSLDENQLFFAAKMSHALDFANFYGQWTKRFRVFFPTECIGVICWSLLPLLNYFLLWFIEWYPLLEKTQSLELLKSGLFSTDWIVTKYDMLTCCSKGNVVYVTISTNEWDICYDVSKWQIVELVSPSKSSDNVMFNICMSVILPDTVFVILSPFAVRVSLCCC